MRTLRRTARDQTTNSLRRRTVRLRLTMLYGTLFALSGAALLAITFLLILRYSPTEFVNQQAGTGATTTKTSPPTHPFGGSAPSRTRHGASAVVHWTGLGHVVTLSVIALAIMTVVSLIVGWFVAGRTLRPLRTMTVTARQISERNLHERLAVEGPSDELKDLGDTIDALLDRLENLVSAQRQFASNASHELRTPLTLERTLLESALTHPDPTSELWRSTCERVLASGQKQAMVIDALLVLARSQQELSRRETLDLASVTAGVIRAIKDEAAQRGVKIDAKLRTSPVSGDSRLVERLISNLLQNAVRHNYPSRGWVRVTVEPIDGRATLEVANTGPAVPADEIDRLFQPFERFEPPRSGDHEGIGLGLSIANAVIQTHHASLSAQPGQSGGLDVIIRFPIPTTPPSSLL